MHTGTIHPKSKPKMATNGESHWGPGKSCCCTSGCLESTLRKCSHIIIHTNQQMVGKLCNSLNKTNNNSPKDHHHLQGYTDIGYPTRQVFGTKATLGNSGSGGRTLKRDTSCSIQVSISCIDAATMVDIHCVQQIERDIVRDCEPKLGHSCDHLRFG